MADTLTADTLLAAYGAGIFPMADSADDPDIFWVDPQRRGILPLTPFHVPRRLKRTVKQDPFRVTVDRAFDRVVDGCAGPRQAAGGTWINDAIRALYEELFRRGHAHSVECWLDDELVGGLYGVNLGAAFFGESMFSRVRDASKLALVHLVARLIVGGYELLDTQFTNAHLEQFGVLEIDRVAYHRLLRRATSRQGDFFAWPEESSGAAALQVINQTS